MKKLYALTMAFAIVFSACEDDSENKPSETILPQVTNIKVNARSSDYQATIGANIIIQAKLSDNEALSQVKLRIYPASGSGSSVSKTYQVSGTEMSFQKAFVLDENMADGAYRLEFRVIDVARNSAAVTNDLQTVIGKPVFSFPFQNSDTLVLAVASTFTLTGQVTDNEDLSMVNVSLSSNRTGPGPVSIYDQDFDFPGLGHPSWDFNGGLDIAIPANALKLHYNLKITAFDNEGNFSTFSQKVYIDP